MIILYVLLAIFVLLLMILIHEAGHYFVGKLLKFEIEEFSIGFGPAIFSKKMKSGEVFSLRCIPLGGFCAFKGEDEDENEDDEDEEQETSSDNNEILEKKEDVHKEFDKTGYFNSYPCWKRLLVLLGGVTFNFISGILFSFVLLMSVGSGVVGVNEVTPNIASISSVDNYHILLELSEGNEILEGDILLKINGNELAFVNGGIIRLAEKNNDKEFTITLKRDGKKIDIKAKNYIYSTDDEETIESKLNSVDPNINVVGLDIGYVRYSVGSALLKCVPYTFDMAWECIVILGELVTGQLGLDAVGGPVTTISTIATSTQTDMRNLLLLFPLIAVNLAVFNLLPIPSLDGARSVFVLIEWVRGKPVPRDIEARIHTIGLMLLFGLVILVDILHIFLL